MNRIGLAISMLAFLAIITSISALVLNGNFYFESDCVIPVSGVWLLQNDSPFREVVEIWSNDSVAANWINLNGKWISKEKEIISLQPHEQKEIAVFVKPTDCYVKPDIYEFKVHFRGSEELIKTVKVKVLETRTLNVTISPNSQIVGQCEPQLYKVKVSNTGREDEDVLLTVRGLPSSWYSLSPTQFYLKKGESKDLALRVEAACDAQLKKYSFSINAQILGTSFVATANANFTIKDKQEIEIEEKEIAVCKEEPSTVNIKITNKGRLADNVRYSISAPSWVSLAKTNATINSNASDNLKINFSTMPETAKDFNIVLRIESMKFGKTTTQTLAIKLLNCYDVNVRALDNVSKACAEEGFVHRFEITNTGLKEIQLNISVNIPNVRISNGKFLLKPKQSKQLSVVFPRETTLSREGKLNYALKISSHYFSGIVRRTLQIEDCYHIVVRANVPTTIDLNAGSEEAYTIRIINKGTKQQTVNLSLTAPTWVKIEPSKLNVKPNETKEAYLFVAPPCKLSGRIIRARIDANARELKFRKPITLRIYNQKFSELSINVSGNVSSAEDYKHFNVKIKLTNDSNVAVKINEIKLVKTEGKVYVKKKELQPNESAYAEVRFSLPKDFNRELLLLKLMINTDKGTIYKIAKVKINKQKQRKTTALFTLTPENTLLIVLIIVIAALVAYIANLKITTKETIERIKQRARARSKRRRKSK